MSRNRSPHGLRPALKYQGLRFARHHGEAFRTPEWSSPVEVYVRPGLWPKVLQVLRRRFANG